jgi:hypothetical protein
MICKIVHFSEAEFCETCVIQIQDDLNIGDSLFISNDHSLIIEHMIESGNTLTILDGEKILKLRTPS